MSADEGEFPPPNDRMNSDLLRERAEAAVALGREGQVGVDPADEKPVSRDPSNLIARSQIEEAVSLADPTLVNSRYPLPTKAGEHLNPLVEVPRDQLRPGDLVVGPAPRFVREPTVEERERNGFDEKTMIVEVNGHHAVFEPGADTRYYREEP